MQSGPYTLELRCYPYDGHLLACPISIKDLSTRLDGRWMGDPYPYYGMVRTPKTYMKKTVSKKVDIYIIYINGINYYISNLDYDCAILEKV